MGYPARRGKRAPRCRRGHRRARIGALRGRAGVPARASPMPRTPRVPPQHRALRKRAGRMPAVPGPAFGGASVSVQTLKRLPLPATSRLAGTCGQDARGPGPRLRRGKRFGTGTQTPPPLPATSRLAGTCGQDARGPGPRLRRGKRFGTGTQTPPPLPATSRLAETCGQDARGPGPRLRRGKRFGTGTQTPPPPRNIAPCGNVRAGCPRSRARLRRGCARYGGRRARRASRAAAAAAVHSRVTSSTAGRARRGSGMRAASFAVVTRTASRAAALSASARISCAR